jgi:hypothetical protein
MVRYGLDAVRSCLQPYRACVVDVFVNCTDRLLAMREEGFVITGVVPESGLVVGHRSHVDSFIMYKEFCSRDDEFERLPMPLASLPDHAEVSNNLTNHCPVDLQAVRLRPVPSYLPITHTLSDSERTRIVIRGLRPDEIPDFYRTLQEAIQSGAGYGLDELPSLEYFVEWYVDDFYNIVYELASTSFPSSSSSSSSTSSPAATGDDGCGDKTDVQRAHSGAESTAAAVIVGYSNFGPSLFGRSVNHAILSDGNVVLRPQFRGLGWSSEILNINSSISCDVGYRCLFGETAVTNPAVLTAMKRNSVLLCGSVPRGVYFRNIGWADLILLYGAYGPEKSFIRAKTMVGSAKL